MKMADVTILYIVLIMLSLIELNLVRAYTGTFKTCLFHWDCVLHVTHSVKMRLLFTWSKLNFWYIIKVYIPLFIMVVKILKSDNHIKQSYAHVTYGVLNNMKWRNRLQSFGFIIKGQLPIGPESSNLHHLGFKFCLKTLTVYLKHNNTHDFAKILKK